MRAKTLSASLLLLAACNVGDSGHVPTFETSPDELVPLSHVEGMPAQLSGSTRARRLVIRSRDVLEAFWAELGQPNSFGPVPEVDFEREMVIAATMGPRGSGGYRITFDAMVTRGSRHHVLVRSSLPGPQCPALGVITSPVDAIVVPIAQGVSFEERTVTYDCRG
ncbi:MAG TPA: protease complex subunit PrcB family protein [Longimicrobium sp.]|nr:protease complex subunit PrcB family protein [Longimicrobium sp.]